MRKNLFCSEIHCEIYAALLHHNLPKMQLRQPKVAKTERATGNNTCDQRSIYPHTAYTERRGSCKMASFSDVKLKAPLFCRCVVEQERNDRLVTMHTSIARGDVWCKN